MAGALQDFRWNGYRLDGDRTCDGPDFPNGQAGDTDTSGLLENYGGIMFGLSPPDTTEERLLFTLPLRGLSAGQAELALQEAASYGLLFGIDQFVTADPSAALIHVVPEPTGYSVAMTCASWLIVMSQRRERSRFLAV